jgi:purine-nucleoside phosphorylase
MVQCLCGGGDLKSLKQNETQDKKGVLMMMTQREKVEKAAAYIRGSSSLQPQIGLVLGSGLGVLAEEVEDALRIPYKQIPHFPVSTVEGHKGEWVMGALSGVTVVTMQGRFHFYEGYGLDEVTFPIRVMRELGIKHLLVTNAAGGVNTGFKPGDLMLITDHINMMFRNPLIGSNVEVWGPRFPDMSNVYDKGWRERAGRLAEKLGIPVRTGVYAGLTGPSYETPAEIRMLRIVGADAVGMSTVPEVIVARHMGMSVLGISCISNMAAGILDQPLSHEEVIDTTERVKTRFITLVKAILSDFAEQGKSEA